MNETVPDNQTTSASERSGFVWELVRTGLTVLLIVLPIRIFIAQPFIVSGASMSPTFSSGDYLIIDQISYRFQDPDRQDIVVFRYPNNPSRFYIKRVIGLPGETVSMEDGQINIINENNPDGFTLEEPYLSGNFEIDKELQVTLGPSEYFVLGDNRQSSSDSRVWGALPERFLVGNAFAQLLPVSDAAIAPGTVSNPRAP